MTTSLGTVGSLLVLLSAAAVAQTAYEPTWESLDGRPCPAWFDEAKLGIFIHWGVYSVPSWAPKGTYAEWYWSSMQDQNGPTWAFHTRTYGERTQYQDFAPMFRAELFDPAQWADLFARSGAKYVALTSKHHDGFCMWPSAESWNWNSVDVGPHRDLLGELTEAVRAKGLKMGFYYSLYEWFNPLYRADVTRYVDQHMLPQLKDAVQRYQPSIIFADGEWDQPSEAWRSTEFLAWLFNESPCKDDVVVNDRWGKECRAVHGGYYTSEYGGHGGEKAMGEWHKWEENRGIGASYGYNRNETDDDYVKPADLVRMLVSIVSAGGNLLLNVGPTADGRIPEIQQQRLIELGDWLAANGEAIYGSRPWAETPADGTLFYTCKGDTVYAITFAWPRQDLMLPEVVTTDDSKATLLGRDESLNWYDVDGKTRIRVPGLKPDELPCKHAWTFRVTKAKKVG